jgi:hypothetical protein
MRKVTKRGKKALASLLHKAAAARGGGPPCDARTISIFRESRHVLEALKLPPQYLLDRLYEAVRCPPGELVERHELISRAQARTRTLRRRLCF